VAGYILSKAAKSDLIGIARYGDRTWGIAMSDDYRDGIIRQFESLVENPRLFREREELSPPVRICPFGSHIILYRLNDKNQIEILRVRHAREDWSEEL